MYFDLGQCDLTRLVLDARQGPAEAQAAFDAASLLVFRRLQRNRLLDDDLRQDFFLAFLPSLRKMIDRFTYQGVRFEHFLAIVMKKRLNSHFRSQRRSRLLWCIAGDASFAPSYGGDEPQPSPVYARLAEVLGVGTDGLPTPAARKWFLVWMLKHCRHLEPADFALTARFTGCDETWLRERAAGLMAQRRCQDMRLEKLRQRRNKLFVRSRILELRIARETDPVEKRALVCDLEIKRASLSNTIRSISRIAWNPSHLAIARTLGFPKATIDTIISRIRHRLETRAAENETSIA
jgi:DNA-directed RNA polymerase specialized sigma24 family protein